MADEPDTNALPGRTRPFVPTAVPPLPIECPYHVCADVEALGEDRWIWYPGGRVAVLWTEETDTYTFGLITRPGEMVDFGDVEVETDPDPLTRKAIVGAVADLDERFASRDPMDSLNAMFARKWLGASCREGDLLVLRVRSAEEGALPPILRPFPPDFRRDVI